MRSVAPADALEVVKLLPAVDLRREPGSALLVGVKDAHFGVWGTSAVLDTSQQSFTSPSLWPLAIDRQCVVHVLCRRAGELFESRFGELKSEDRELDATQELATLAKKVPALASEFQRKAGEYFCRRLCPSGWASASSNGLCVL